MAEAPQIDEGRSPGPVRRLYEWVLLWAESPWAPWALFTLAFAEACFFPVPPDVLLVAMCLAKPRRGPRYALITVGGSVIGGLLCYALGAIAFDTVGRTIIEAYGKQAEIAEIQSRIGSHGFAWVFVAALTPIPYCVFVLVAGMAHEVLSVWTLLGASILGRGLRFGTQGVLFRTYGTRVKSFIDRYFNMLTIAGTVALALLLLCAKMLSSCGTEATRQVPDRPPAAGPRVLDEHSP